MFTMNYSNKDFMLLVASVLALVLVVTAESYTNYENFEPTYEQKGKLRCYQCAYSPPHVVYEETKVPTYKKDEYGRVVATYKIVKVSKQGTGGWNKCLGPFDDDYALSAGIDLWECDSNCYTRADKNGNIFRGCYNGEFGVQPDALGCTEQQGSTYCFCNTDSCNNEKAPQLPVENVYY